MIFLIIFICCAIEVTYMSFAPLRNTGWVIRWHAWLANTLGLRWWFGSAIVLVSITLPCALVAYVFGYAWVDSTLLSLIGGVAMLLVCFGPRDLARDIESYTSNYRDNRDDQLPPDKDNFLNSVAPRVGDPDQPYQRAIAAQANERLFAPAFWFAILGPAGALAFRMSSTLMQSNEATGVSGQLNERLYYILLWLPARLLALGFGLVGTLAPILALFRGCDYGLSESSTLLGDAAIGALDSKVDESLGDDEQHIAALNNTFQMVKRGFVIWLVALALLAAAGFV